MKNSKTTKSNISEKDIIKKLIELYENQEKLKISYKVIKKEEGLIYGK